jgi:hypothetical protein
MSLRHGVLYNQYRGHTLVSPPAFEPVTLTELKAQIKHPGGNDEDASLALYISAAREYCEEVTGLALITQSWLLTIDRWPTEREPWWDGVRDGAIGALTSAGRAAQVLLPRYPLQTVDGIDVDGSAISVGDTFQVDAQQTPGRLVLKFGATLPQHLQTANAIQITYTAGYGDAASAVPAALRLALLQMAAYLYTHRGDDCASPDAASESGALAVFNRYRAMQL